MDRSAAPRGARITSVWLVDIASEIPISEPFGITGDDDGWVTTDDGRPVLTPPQSHHRLIPIRTLAIINARPS